MSTEAIEKPDPPADEGVAGEPRDAAARRSLRPRLLPAREPGRLPRASASTASTSAATRRAPSPRTCSATSARSTPSSSRSRSTSRWPPATRSGRRASSSTYDSLLRGINGATRVQVDASGRAHRRPASACRSRGRATTCASRSTRSSSATARRRCRRFGLPGGFVAMEVDTGEILAMGSVAHVRPLGLREARHPAGRVADAIFERRRAEPRRRSSTARPRAAIPPGSTFKLITATAALEDGLDHPGARSINDARLA